MKTTASLAVAIGATSALAGALAPRASTIPKVTVKGNGMLITTPTQLMPILTCIEAFFAGSERFYVRGVDYQPGGSSDAADPIADITKCKRDIVE